MCVFDQSGLPDVDAMIGRSMTDVIGRLALRPALKRALRPALARLAYVLRAPCLLLLLLHLLYFIPPSPPVPT